MAHSVGGNNAGHTVPCACQSPRFRWPDGERLVRLGFTSNRFRDQTTVAGESWDSSSVLQPSKLDISGTPAPISWPGFPNKIEIEFGDDPQKTFQEAELRNNQDEYLEWATVKRNGKITKVMFTCEGPEYWKFIA